MSDGAKPTVELIEQARRTLRPLSEALYNFEAQKAEAVLKDVFADDALLRLCHPLTVGHDGEREGGAGYWGRAISQLAYAMPDMERRTWISIAGATAQGGTWVGHAGTYVGTFAKPFLDILPTGHLAHMRFHEFFRVEDGKVVEMQMIWDIPELLLQAGLWPMSPSLGREWCTPAPATMDGQIEGPHDPERAAKGCDQIVQMLEAMKLHPAHGGPEVMRMDEFWHPKMNWYGPSGIGTGRGIEGFRKWHQIPFLAAMPDRGQTMKHSEHHFFGEENYVAVTGWPNMAQTLTDDGWLGLAASGQKLTLRSLDFWRLEGDLIRENWVLVDLLDMYRQVGVDVLARMRDIASAQRATVGSW